MRFSAITDYVDVAQVTLYVFWGFFAGLIFYIRREDKREGYPLTTSELPEQTGRLLDGFPPMPPPKTFVRHDGVVTYSPSTEGPSPPPLTCRPVALWPGAPIEPLGNPLLAGVGPGAWVDRIDEPDTTYRGDLKIIPLRASQVMAVDPEGLDPRGMRVVGADRVVAGRVVDLWVDVVEKSLRYLEVEIAPELLEAAAADHRVAAGRVAAGHGVTGREVADGEVAGGVAPAPVPSSGVERGGALSGGMVPGEARGELLGSPGAVGVSAAGPGEIRTRRVMLPERFVRYSRSRGEVTVRAILGGQFRDVPRLRDPERITFREEDKITAYYGAGTLYATPGRIGPLL